MRSFYTRAVGWIAFNDESGELNPLNIKDSLTVLLVADLYEMPPLDVARDVVSKRQQKEKP